jgi:hypothetical protein
MDHPLHLFRHLHLFFYARMFCYNQIHDSHLCYYFGLRTLLLFDLLIVHFDLKLNSKELCSSLAFYKNCDHQFPHLGFAVSG